ncbi:hypothetical protein NW768_010622 [Fusarium equiseti]|uniref:Alcohol dehydrogenase-like C-terminal domain-containing protein n=1 Tax=Fusarium equiseti TaxID=61235 RepID=A0ABQ8R095_FUSEQ|nr:hypothetical protein NW768_010622 [Fusarium equiseti]
MNDNILVPQVSTSLVLNSFNGQLDMEKTPIPKPTPPGSVIVGILSTPVRPHQRAGFHGKSFLSFTPPYNPGDGGIGRVISVGPDIVSLNSGQLVYMSNFVAARDDPSTRVLLGLHDGGGPERDSKLFNFWKGFWRDIAIVPAENVLPLNEKILVDDMGYSFGELNYIQRLSVAYGGVRAADLHAGQTVIVAPATGHFSGAVVELAAQIGCRVVALTRSASKLELLTSRFPRVIALELTGDEKGDTEAIRALTPEGVDAYIDISPPAATESPHHLNVSISSLRSFARVVFLGLMFDVKINYASLMVRNITIKAQSMYTREELASVIKMIETGVVKLGKEAGHEIVERGFRLNEWERAVAVAETATAWGQQVLLFPSAEGDACV